MSLETRAVNAPDIARTVLPAALPHPCGNSRQTDEAFMKRSRRLILALLAGFTFGGAWTAAAEPTRIAIIYAESDEPLPVSFERMIASMEMLTEVQVIRLELDSRQSSRFTSQLFLTNSLPGGPLRLAAAGGAGSIAVIYPDIGEPYRLSLIHI